MGRLCGNLFLFCISSVLSKVLRTQIIIYRPLYFNSVYPMYLVKCCGHRLVINRPLYFNPVYPVYLVKCCGHR
jgi:hypothetical protein